MVLSVDLQKHNQLMHDLMVTLRQGIVTTLSLETLQHHLLKLKYTKKMEVDIRLAAERLCQEEVAREPDHLVTPGDTVTGDAGFMRGHGTYKDGEDLVASVAGFVRRINKLISVQPLKARYNGEIGDVVIGRVVEVQQRRWKVDTCSRLHSLLMLSSVNLPGGEQRRKTQEDELAMRSYLEEGDLISAEVQNVFSDGSLSLHTRSLKYGKLSQGVMVTVPPSLVMRRKNHFHDLPCGGTVILGNNGYIWICPTTGGEDGGAGTGGYAQNLERVPLADREVVSRLRNCILALAASWMMLYDTSILYAYEASAKFQARDLLKPEVMLEVADLTRKRLELEAAE